MRQYRGVVDANQQRRQLAEEVSRHYSLLPGVAAVALGGSVARVWADRHSDIELYVFWKNPPTDEERIGAVTAAGGIIDVDWRRRGAAAVLRRAVAAKGAAVGQLWPLEDDEWSEHFVVDGIPVAVSGFLVGTVDRWIEAVAGGDPGPFKYLPATLMTCLPLSDEGLLAQWRARLEEYPRALAVASIRTALQPERDWHDPWWDAPMLAERGDALAIGVVAGRMQRRILAILHALNGQYLAHPDKWASRWVDLLSEVPERTSSRLFPGRYTPHAIRDLQELFEEVLDLLDARLPEVDTAEARAWFRATRPKSQR